MKPWRLGALALALIIIASIIVVIEAVRPGAAPSDVTSMFSPKAPEIAGIASWLNSEPLSLASLRGKVVLVDFWTYSCINCIRTLPHLVAWDAAYRDKGLVIIGVHTPEFEFEKERANVEAALAKHGIRYPVALDNDYATWRAFKNNYWPRKYLIDRTGAIVYDHIGEGGYEETEAKIQQLLSQPGPVVSETVQAEEPGAVGTPELYFGSAFLRQPYGNDQQPRLGAETAYALPRELQPNAIYLEGTWLARSDSAESRSDGKIVLGFIAQSANLVLGADAPAELEVLVDGAPSAAADVQDGRASVQEERLYNLYAGSPGAHVLEVRVPAGVRAYAFTFG